MDSVTTRELSVVVSVFGSMFSTSVTLLFYGKLASVVDIIADRTQAR